MPEPAPEDGPLFRAAYREADAVDASGPRASAGRPGCASRLPRSRRSRRASCEALISGAVLFSVISAVIGATSGEVSWTVGCVTAGVAGTILVAVARHWSFGRQWAVNLGVLPAAVRGHGRVLVLALTGFRVRHIAGHRS